MKAWKIAGKIFIILVIFLFVIHIVNKRELNHTLDTIINTLDDHYTLEDIELDSNDSPYKSIPFVRNELHKKTIKELGTLSFHIDNLGILDVLSLTIVPLERDVPLLTLDITYFTLIRKLNINLISVVSEDNQRPEELIKILSELDNLYSDLSNDPFSNSWRDELMTLQIDKASLLHQDEEILLLIAQVFDLYSEHSQEYPLLNSEEKIERLAKLDDFISRLIASEEFPTKLFVRRLGEETARELLRKFLL